MQLDKNEAVLLESLTRFIRDLERLEDDPKTINFVARRIGNIVKHMKDLRDDLKPRGTGQIILHRQSGDERTNGRTDAAH